jgi:hypothetical protein
MSGPPFQWNPYWHLYRLVMRIAHLFNWHYAPPTHGIMPGNDTQLWCQWCGMRYTVPKRSKP